MKNKTKKSIITASLIALGAPAVYMCAGLLLFNRLTVTKYTLNSKKISRPIKIVLISDLHGYIFGENQSEIINVIKKQKPDMIMLAGDIFVEYRPYEGSFMLLEGIASICTCYFVAGNHEFLTEEVHGIKEFVRDCGIEVLEGNCKNVTVNGQQINICGLDDPFVGLKEFNKELEDLSAVDKKSYSILISHHTEHIDVYRKLNFDLVLTGHAHGGQWRLPPFSNGVFAPSQGFFPKYAGGQYKYNNSTQIVSRGMSKFDLIPRIYNPPELVVIDIEPM